MCPSEASIKGVLRSGFGAEAEEEVGASAEAKEELREAEDAARAEMVSGEADRGVAARAEATSMVGEANARAVDEVGARRVVEEEVVRGAARAATDAEIEATRARMSVLP